MVDNIGILLDNSDEFGKIVVKMAGVLSALASLNWVLLCFGLVVVFRKLSSDEEKYGEDHIMIDNFSNVKLPEESDEKENQIEIDSIENRE